MNYKYTFPYVLSIYIIRYLLLLIIICIIINMSIYYVYYVLLFSTSVVSNSLRPHGL